MKQCEKCGKDGVKLDISQVDPESKYKYLWYCEDCNLELSSVTYDPEIKRLTNDLTD